MEICDRTASNMSSMLQDVRRNQITEVDYINGWIVRRGEELGVHCIVNYSVQHMVHMKSWLAHKRSEGKLPFEDLRQ